MWWLSGCESRSIDNVPLAVVLMAQERVAASRGLLRANGSSNDREMAISLYLTSLVYNQPNGIHELEPLYPAPYIAG